MRRMHPLVEPLREVEIYNFIWLETMRITTISRHAVRALYRELARRGV
jgi:hypothetical protein